MGDVQWPNDPMAFEQAIAVLLSCMHPTLLRVDGVGGDGGRDAQFTDAGGLHVFEMKSFIGRMTKGRRAKVERSLTRAALLRPVSWDVVVPIDLNPAELEWFDSLQPKFPFPLSWRGATWIKARLVEHPAVRRFYFADHQAELGHLLQEIARRNIAPVATAADAATRLRQLCDRLAELDPHYNFRITAGPGQHTGTEVLPAYPGADRDQPLHIALSFTDPDTPEGRRAVSDFERCRRYGDPIELPTGFLHLSGPASLLPPTSSDRVRVEAVPEPRDLPAQLIVTDQAGRRLAALGLHMTSIRSGTDGGTLTGTDPSGAVTCRLRVDRTTRESSIKIDVEVPEHLRPAQWLDVVQFASQAEPGTNLHMTLAGHPVNDPAPFRISPRQGGSVPVLHLLEQLVAIERLAVTTLLVPKDPSTGDLLTVREAHTLLTGGTVEEVVSSATMEADNTTFVRGLLAGDHPVRLRESHPEYEVEIFGQSVPIGPVVRTMPPLFVSSHERTADGWRITLTPGPEPGANLATLQRGT
ncbi:hypothetical protein [Streptomyces sp. WAC06614]|uniref:hypothetical protein n=1 Tax=Streptomyces sp. WAC06614 TaxID=2487416 RepID=UPI000F79C721|nr:hypothetical protein [Streptomyces sp. WAC06614]RSS81742.1 hypothetical protein EF918_09305 [Streptomyces sp. WAC06614]